MDMSRSSQPRGVYVYHCWTFTVPPGAIYDVKTNHYPNSQAIFENININVSAPCTVYFHSLSNDPIHIIADEEGLVISNFKFRKVYIDNDSSASVDVRIMVFTKNELIL